MNKIKKVTLLFIILLNSINLLSQKQLIQFSFDTNLNPTTVNTAIGVSPFQVKVASSDMLIQKPAVITDGSVNSLFFQFNSYYDISTNNASFAIAPKAGSNVKITHIEFRVRFGSVSSGSGGIFISKDPNTVINTLLWSCGNNNTFNKYKDFVVSIPDSLGLNYSESTTDSIHFVFGHGKNTQGMYFDNFVIYGIVNNETNPVQNLSVDVALISKDLVNHPTGANTCWLMDSDAKWPRTVSNESRFAELKLGSLRFPYGHLADNYLWHTPGHYDTVENTGPIPQVASLNEDPAKWTWAVNQTDGTFLKDLSFDEYVGICKRNGIEPLIVINAESYKYTGGPSYATLKASALEWVRYANITKGYGIKYWQIGNEIEHNGILSESEYINLFKDFSTVMKAIDSTIKVGTGVASSTTWNKDVLTQAGTLCNFISTHNYQFNSAVAAGGFRTWYKDNSILASSVYNTQNMLSSNFSNRPDIDILVTETNATGGDFPDVNIIDIYKALYWFEMDMNELSQKNVKYTYYWGSHSPWSGETDPGYLDSFLENSAANTVRPAGRVIQLINTYLKEKLINTIRVIGNLRTYASISKDGNELSVFILNKNLYAEKANLNLLNFDKAGAQVEQITYKGLNYSDVTPVISTEQHPSMPAQIELAPVSLTILHFTKSGNTAFPAIENENIKLYFDGENIHTQFSEEGNAKLNIYSINGQWVTSKDIKKKSDVFNLLYLNKGIYIATFRTHNSFKTTKIIK